MEAVVAPESGDMLATVAEVGGLVSTTLSFSATSGEAARLLPAKSSSISGSSCPRSRSSSSS